MGRQDYTVVAILRSGDKNLFVTDSRNRALLAFQTFYNSPNYSKVILMLGTLIFDQNNLDAVP